MSPPGAGQGIELGWADYATTPILCIYEKGLKISSSLKFITNNYIEYENTDDMIKKFIILYMIVLKQINSKL